MDTRLGGRGLCPLSMLASLLNTSGLLITLFRCLKFLVQAHLGERLYSGLGGWKPGKDSSPFPGKQATLEISSGGNEG